MANAKDEADAYNTYVKAFSDGKGAHRVHDMTEVDADTLKQWLGGHGKSTKKPYGTPYAKAPKPVQERAVMKDLIAKREAKGDTEGAEKLRNAPEEQARAAIEGKRLRKYGNNGNWPVEGVPGSSAHTEPMAAELAAKHKVIADWFEETKPPSQLDPSKETDGE